MTFKINRDADMSQEKITVQRAVDISGKNYAHTFETPHFPSR
jgi:hypothetical protein